MSSPSRPSSQRLLYCGALSLPDSYLLLNESTFSAQIDAEHNLLENPLALALESMRGKPTLRFMGAASLKDIHIDDSGGITLDIHPEATLSIIYFENMFSLPSTSKDILGIRIALGDSAGPETTQIIVFSKSIPNENDPKQPLSILSVARITPMPTIKPRLPRPDDPTPRKPPLVPFGKGPDLRRVASFNASSDALARKRQKLSNGSAILNLGSDVRLGQKLPSEGIFKVPLLPDKNTKSKAKDKAKDKGKGKTTTVDDVFGPGASTGSTNAGKRKVENQGKRKREHDEGSQVEGAPQERDNKNRIKQAVTHQLANSPIPKTHLEYKDVFNCVYHGVCFALRADMKACPIEQQSMERLVLMHVGMYTGKMLQPPYTDEPIPGAWVP